MNSALDNLYDDLLRQADQEPGEEITEAEKAKRFLGEKRVAVEKLREISLRNLKDANKRKEEARLRELERKRQAAIDTRLQKEKREKELVRYIEENTVRFWKRGVNGKRQQTGVVYFGESKRRGDAWVPHGHGEYRVHGESIYEGTFVDGMMHGRGRLLVDEDLIWDGQLLNDMVHGLGTLTSQDGTKQRAIYWQGRRVCFLDDISPGARLQLLGDEFIRNDGGKATVVCASGRGARYRLRLESGKEKLLRLECEHFRLLRHRPRVVLLDAIVGSAEIKKMYDYDTDQAYPQTSAYRENFYWPDLWAAREEAEKKKQAELDLQTKRSQILAKRQVEKHMKAAADKEADVARGLEEDRKRKAEVAKEEAAAASKGQESLAAALAAGEEKKRRQKELSGRW